MGEKDELIARIEAADLELRRHVVRQGATDFFSIDLTIQQLRALFILASAGALSAHELAEGLGVGPTTLTGIVDRLEAREVVCRLPDGRDRRVRRIDLTEAGRRIIHDLHEVKREFQRTLLCRLDVGALAGLATGIEALARVCEEQVREGGHRDHEAETGSTSRSPS